MIYELEDFEVLQSDETYGGYPCVTVVPPGSMPMFEMTAGHAIALGEALASAGRRAMDKR